MQAECREKGGRVEAQGRGHGHCHALTCTATSTAHCHVRLVDAISACEAGSCTAAAVLIRAQRRPHGPGDGGAQRRREAAAAAAAEEGLMME